MTTATKRVPMFTICRRISSAVIQHGKMRRARVIAVAALLILLTSVSCAGESRNQKPIIGPNDHVVLACGSGPGPAGLPLTREEIFLAIPDVIVYDTGLVIFLDKGQEKPEIYQSQVPPDRVDRLIKAIYSVGFSQDLSSETGSHGSVLIAVHTPEASDTVYWSSAGNPPSKSIIDTLGIIQTFVNEAKTDKTVYQPEKIALWLSRRFSNYDCSVDETRCNGISSWPFKVELPQESDSCSGYHYFEIALSYSDVMEAIPDMDKRGIWREVFRVGDTIFEVDARPYLPGETMRSGCFEHPWFSPKTTYDTLPFYIARH